MLIPTLDVPVLGARPAVLRSPLFTIHVASVLFAYASFALACMIGVTYVLLFKEIKAKHLGFFYARLPSLQVLDRMNMRAVTIGWVVPDGGRHHRRWSGPRRPTSGHRRDPRAQAMTMMDPKIFFAFVSWGVYSFELFARRTFRWGARRIGLALGNRVRHRAAELPADRLTSSRRATTSDAPAARSA